MPSYRLTKPDQCIGNLVLFCWTQSEWHPATVSLRDPTDPKDRPDPSQPGRYKLTFFDDPPTFVTTNLKAFRLFEDLRTPDMSQELRDCYERAVRWTSNPQTKPGATPAEVPKQQPKKPVAAAEKLESSGGLSMKVGDVVMYQWGSEWWQAKITWKKNTRLRVEFFDDPPTYELVERDQIKPYAERHHLNKKGSNELIKSFKRADAYLLKKSRKDAPKKKPAARADGKSCSEKSKLSSDKVKIEERVEPPAKRARNDKKDENSDRKAPKPTTLRQLQQFLELNLDEPSFRMVNQITWQLANGELEKEAYKQKLCGALDKQMLQKVRSELHLKLRPE
eukprot:TRINITY_DN8237_c0_g1_i2.p1 TRINITY_DN8237_c0_g1~~TRINITY_DN8237_c0_g1_i2.p1  ORF type:complete len:336 (-),score=65.44 TRINITY_DN8237_c0_g1_i2:103-1110(-)